MPAPSPPGQRPHPWLPRGAFSPHPYPQGRGAPLPLGRRTTDPPPLPFRSARARLSGNPQPALTFRSPLRCCAQLAVHTTPIVRANWFALGLIHHAVRLRPSPPLTNGAELIPAARRWQVVHAAPRAATDPHRAAAKMPDYELEQRKPKRPSSPAPPYKMLHSHTARRWRE